MYRFCAIQSILKFWKKKLKTLLKNISFFIRKKKRKFSLNSLFLSVHIVLLMGLTNHYHIEVRMIHRPLNHTSIIDVEIYICYTCKMHNICYSPKMQFWIIYISIIFLFIIYAITCFGVIMWIYVIYCYLPHFNNILEPLWLYHNSLESSLWILCKQFITALMLD